MQRRKLSIGSIFALAMLAATMLMTATQVAAQTETILHSFGMPRLDGQRPTPGLAIDASGNVYGTTQFGGAYGYGMLFELIPAVGGGYTEKVIHSFNFNHADGIYPQAGVILDAAGNLYGTANEGGANGYGAVFELSPHTGGSWTGKILYSFRALPDGQNPSSALTFDAAGNLYGTTAYGGVHGANGGTVFKLTPSAGGGWTKKTLYSFNYSGGDGYYPLAGVILDVSGNIYGNTTNGGLYTNGIAFELVPGSGGIWTEVVLHNFGNGADGKNPLGPLVFDGSGNLFGGTANGGANAAGIVFELSPVTGGGWNESVVYNFGSGTDGDDPGTGGLIFDGLGNLYGTTSGGGPATGGTLFKLSPAGGTWTISTLYGFGATGDGNGPQGVTVDASGNFFGTTLVGGAHNEGTVFEIVL